ncbi:HAD superfamily hydrolase (TIGR01549 family) [Lactobacillus colini]|uniref:HAD superfamily hydrolase (TIGR01549 family) n=1 Tax=Lactobacillus colini TaxID=1819254 RepID=A0ABS4MG83_9LACO|nr:HAD family hydrolase [Lactobacillus colini]MBP2058705.1 HAD superfamily hydrolase (TIGR01549 family) [Lactobacillus colini]
MVSLIFDLGNTLKKDLSLETSKDISREIFRKFDVDENTIKTFNQMLLDSLREKKENFTAKSILSGLLDDDQICEKIIDQISQELAERFSWNYDTKSVLENLTQRGYSIFLLSNSIWNSKFYISENEDYFKYFTDVFFSDQIGFRKPSRNAFLKVIKSYNLAINETWMIGDSEENDILPAKELGLKTIKVANNLDSTNSKSKCHFLSEILNIIIDGG